MTCIRRGFVVGCGSPGYERGGGGELPPGLSGVRGFAGARVLGRC